MHTQLRNIIQRLSSRRVLWRGLPQGDNVFLTFDDGPHPTHTSLILDVLQEYNAKATFFVIGDCVRRSPELVSEIAGRGHALGLHNDSHVSFKGLSYMETMHQIEGCRTAVSNIVGVNPRIVRPPWGVVTVPLLLYALIKRYRLVLWSLDSGDHRADSVQTISDQLTTPGVMRAGDVVLLHDDCRYTPQALPEILAVLRERGLQAECLGCGVAPA